MITISRVLAGLLLLACSLAQASEKVVLQLKWEPSFQFAGYYAALWQGYYADEGLDVEIRSAFSPEGEFVEPIQQLVSGEVDFAVGILDALQAKDAGADIKIVSPIFQHSPLGIYSLTETPLDSVRDLRVMRISVNAEDMATEIRALMRAQGYITDESLLIPTARHTASHLAPLLAGKVDAIVTYGVAAEVEARQLGIQLNALLPSEFGLDLYGDTLFTRQKVVDQRPGLVEKFRRATLKGWQYALKHRHEIADKITLELPRQHYLLKDFKAFNREFAEVIDRYLVYPYVPLGQSNKTRWRQMVQDLRLAGALSGDWTVDSLFLAETPPIWQYWRELAMLTAGLLLLLVPISLSRFRFPRSWPYLLIIAGTIAANYLIDEYADRAEQQEVKLDTAQFLDSLSDKFHGHVRNNLALTNSMAAYIGMHTNLEQRRFTQYAESIFRLNSLLNNIAAAPDMVISMMYPMQGNEAALGIDYRENLAQWQGVDRAIKRKKATLDGPINLLQGGEAFIIHSPVFNPNGKLWGVVSAPLRTEKLYQAADIQDPNLPWEITIALQDPTSGERRVILGDEALYSHPSALETSLKLGGSTWLIGARPKPGKLPQDPSVVPLHIGTLVIATLLIFLAWYIQRQSRRERRFQAQLQQNEKLLHDAGKLASIDGWKLNSQLQFTQWGDEHSRLTKISSTKQAPPHLDDVLAMLDEDQARKLRRNLVAATRGLPFDIEVHYRTPKQSDRWFRVIGDPIREKNGWSVVGATQDITEKRRRLEEIEHQASHDQLTGLPNRGHFNQALDEVITQGVDSSATLAVLFIDLDNFKPVNDNMGHRAGDALLCQVGSRIDRCLRDGDLVARYSGDEFTVYLQIEAGKIAPQDVAQRILEAINRPYRFEQQQVYCGASIGISVYPQNGETAEELVSNADQAMYQVKNSGRNSWHSFTSQMHTQSARKHLLHTRLAAALEAERLDVYYQPICRLADSRVVKCEALVRWHEDGELIPTDEFIAVAEEVGLVNQIDRFVLQQATARLSKHFASGLPPVALSVNVSPLIFAAQNASLKAWMDRVVEAATQLDLTVEITERLLTEDSERALEVLTRLKENGIRIAIDDFGTGYSSLSYLTKFPIDIIKIDRSFIGQLGENVTSMTLTNAILSLSQKLSLDVIAEGIETRSQCNYLRQRGCELGQGYLLGKPMPEADFVEMLRQQAQGSPQPEIQDREPTAADSRA